jgi:hypothetical protein
MPQKIPCDLEAEKIVLGNCLLTDSAAPLADLTETVFYSDQHRKIAAAIRSLSAQKIPVSLLELTRELEARKSAVLPSYVSSLMDGIPSMNGSLEYYRKRVADLAQERAVLAEGINLGAAIERGESSEEIFRRAKTITEKYKPEPEESPEAQIEIRPLGCPEVPQSAFYGISKVYRDLLADRSEPSDSFHLACFITIAGALLGRYVYMRMPKLIYPNHYTVLVGASNWAGKGTAMSFAEELLGASQLVTPIYSVDSAEGTARRIRDAIQQDENRKRGSVLFLIDEFNALINKASQKGSKIIPDLKRNYDWRPWLEINSSMSPVRIQDPPTFNVLAGSEQIDLSDMQPRDLAGGMGNRWMFVPGEGKALNPDAEPPFDSDWKMIIGHLREIVDFWIHEGPRHLKFSDEAWKRWRPWYKSLKKRGEGDARVQLLAARHRVFVAKVALTWAGLDRSTEYVEIDHLEAALAWCDFQLDGLYYIFKGVGLKPWVREALEIVEYVKRQGGAVPRRKLQARFAALGPEGFERQLKFLLSDDGHPERELKQEGRWGKHGRQVNWVAVNA